jgi:outer membrane protein OmpA-like peptidoglycan-associated protein
MNTTMSRWGAAATGFALAVGLAACGSATTPTPSASASPTTAATTASTAGAPDGGQLEVAEQPWWQAAPSGTTPPPKTVTISLPADVLFQPDSPALTPGATTQLAALQQRYLTPDPNATITITGHTDIGTGSGIEAATKALSTARAAAVRDWLTAHGIPTTAITIHGVGDTEPLYPSNTDAHRAANRRCDITATTTAG